MPKNSHKKLHFFIARNMQQFLLNFAYSNIFSFNCNFNWITSIFPCKILYISVKSCRKKHSLASFCFWKLFQNLTQIIIKSHIKHTVCFINNTEICIAQVQVSTFIQINYTTRSTNYNINSFLQS